MIVSDLNMDILSSLINQYICSLRSIYGIKNYYMFNTELILHKESGAKLNLKVNTLHDTKNYGLNNLYISILDFYVKNKDLGKFQVNDITLVEFKYKCEKDEFRLLESSFNPLLLVTIILKELSSITLLLQKIINKNIINKNKENIYLIL